MADDAKPFTEAPVDKGEPKPALLGEVLKDIVTAPVGAVEFAGSGLVSTADAAGRGLADIALASQGVTLDPDLESHVSYTPKTEVGQFLDNAFGKLAGKWDSGMHALGDAAYDSIMNVQVPKGREEARAKVAAGVGAAIHAGGDVAPAALMAGDSPLKPFLKPVGDVVKKGYEATQEKIHGGSWAMARDVQAKVEKGIAQNKETAIGLTKVLKGAQEGDFTEADYDAVRYFAQSKDKLPSMLSPKQWALWAGYVRPLRQQLGLTDADTYFPRFSLDHKSALSAFVRGSEPPSITPKLSTAQVASHERLYYENKGELGVMRVEKLPGKNQHKVQRYEGGKVQPLTGGLTEDIIDTPDGLLLGRDYFGQTGKPYHFGETTVEKVEANTPVRYVHHPVLAYAQAVWEKTLVNNTRSLVDSINAHTEALGHSAPIDKEGFTTPKDWEMVRSPFFGNRLYSPAVARVLNATVGRAGSWEKYSSQLNRASIGLSFVLSPAWHPMNVSAFWLADHFSRLSSMEAWKSMPRNFAKAWKEVTSYGPDYTSALRAGAPLMKARTMATEDFRKVMQATAEDFDTARVRKMVGDDKLWATMRQGLAFFWDHTVQPAERFTHWAAWQFNDVFLMQAAYDRVVAKPGMSFEDAMADTAKSFPQYRIPYTSSMLTTLHKSGLFFFLPYHLDRFRVLWNQAAVTALGDGNAAAQLAGTLLLSQVIYPEMNVALQEKTKNPRAYVEPFGHLKVISAISDAAARKRSAWSLMNLMLTPTIPLTVMEGKAETVKPKHGIYPSWTDQFENIGENLGEIANYPLADAIRSQERDPASLALTQLGVFQPKAPKTGGHKGSMKPPVFKPPKRD